MDASRLQPRASQGAPAPVTLPAPAGPAPVPTPASGEAVGKLDPITQKVLSTVKPCSVPVAPVAVAALHETEGLSAETRPEPLPRVAWVGMAVAVLGGVAWMISGARGQPTVPTQIPRAPQAAPNIPLPAHVPTRSSPLSRPEYTGFVVVGG